MNNWSFLVHSTGYGEDIWLPIFDFINKKELRPVPKDIAKKEGIEWKRKVYTTYLYSDFPYNDDIKGINWSWKIGVFKFIIDTEALNELQFKGCSPVQGGCTREVLAKNISDLSRLQENIEFFYNDRIKDPIFSSTAYNYSHEIVFDKIPLKFILGVGVYDKELMDPLIKMFKIEKIKLPVAILFTRAKDGVSAYKQNIKIFKKWKQMKSN